jgi:hypothetical protein
MSIKTRIRLKNDGELLDWWREWLKALDAEMATDDGNEAERRHDRVEVIQRTIAHTPSEGLLGIAIKLALTSYLEGFADGSDGDVGRSAYLDTLRIIDRDFVAEAEAVLTRCSERELT